MKRRVIYLIASLFAFSFSTDAIAQLSERINNPTTIRAGARPVAGNFGFYLGLSSNQIGDLFDQQTNVEDAIPLINVRYYMRDDIVLRAGIAIWKKSRTLEGEIDTSSIAGNPFQNGGQGYGAIYEHKEMEAYTLIHIGIEKHFKATNLLDGYVGASLPFGYSRAENFTNNQGNDASSGSRDYLQVTSSRFSFVYGAELFIGANAFVADLPLAIGVELGVQGLGVRGENLKQSMKALQVVPHILVSTTPIISMTLRINLSKARLIQADLVVVQSSSPNKRSFDTRAMIRFTLNYYFK